MELTLTPEQKAATEWLKDGSFLCADIGTGKTVISATAIADAFEKDPGRTLVLGPKMVVTHTWPEEYQLWPHLQRFSCEVAVGTAAQREAALESGADVVCMNFENVPWLFNTYQEHDFKYLIIDEIDKLSRTSNRFKKLVRKIGSFEKVIGMTGTPVTESLEELWAIFRLTNSDVFPRSFRQFQRAYFYPIDRDGNMWKCKNESMLIERVKPYIYRLEADYPVDFIKEDILPDKAVIEAQKCLIKNMEVSIGVQKIEVESRSALSQKLVQLASGFIYDLNASILLCRAKERKLRELLDRYKGEKILVCYWYKASEVMLPQIQILGGKDSAKAINSWNYGKLNKLALHPASAGHGLNLQKGGCHRMVFMTMPWSGRLFAQAIGRLARRGQTNRVKVHCLVAKGTADERVFRAVKNKTLAEANILKEMIDE